MLASIIAEHEACNDRERQPQRNIGPSEGCLMKAKRRLPHGALCCLMRNKLRRFVNLNAGDVEFVIPSTMPGNKQQPVVRRQRRS